MAQLIKDLEGKTIVLGITGGIAAYKAAELTRRLQDHGAAVQVVMTEAATRFISPVTMQALSQRTVYTSQWDDRIQNNMGHIELGRSADLILVVPASADFMAKLSQGLADDLLCTLCLARDCPLLIAPAMNRQMWSNPATQRNVVQLHTDGVLLLGPTAGDQACGEVGAGRMLEPDEILDDVIAFFQPKLLQDKRVLVTAGPTFEPIDPVRGLTNLSSGKMGYAMARAAQEAGARVTLISGASFLEPPRGTTCIHVQTAQQMLDEVLAYVGHAQIFIAVAAVGDWRIANPSSEKIKKGDDPTAPMLDFVENPDILATVAALPDAPYCVGFAAETQDLDANAQAKRRKKGVPLLIGNLAQYTLGQDDGDLVLCDESGSFRIGRADKLTLARRLVGEIASRIDQS